MMITDSEITDDCRPYRVLILRGLAQYIQPSRLTKIGAVQLIEGTAQRKTHDTESINVRLKTRERKLVAA